MYSVVLAALLTTGTAAPGSGGGYGFSGWSDATGYGATGYGVSGWGYAGAFGATGFGLGAPCGGFNPFRSPCICPSCPTCCDQGGHGMGLGSFGGDFGGLGSFAGGFDGLGSFGGGFGAMAVASAEENPATPSTARAQLVVELPAGAVLFVEGRRSKVTSPKHVVVTPDLQAGAEYSYTLKVEALRDGKKVKWSKKVIFQAGQTLHVQFSPGAEDRKGKDVAVTRVTPPAPEDESLASGGSSED
jgi:uncharacterized protein (TIGR03000 family)